MKKNNNFTQVTRVGYAENSLMMTMKKVEIIVTWLENFEKQFVGVLKKILVFTCSMQFMNSSLEKLVKNLSDNDFKYLTEKFGSTNLELLKQKDAYP